MARKAVLLLFLGLGAFPSISLAQSFLDRFCFNRSIIPPTFEKPFRIPVGCEIIDCCPGCPGGGIEWRISVDSKLWEGAELRFEGLDPAALRRLTLSGNARVDGTRIVLQPGNSSIAGFEGAGARKVPVALLRPLVEKAAVERLGVSQGGVRRSDGDWDADGISGKIVIQQLIGVIPVNSFRWDVVFYPCNRPILPRGDQLKVQSISGGDNVVVMMDARTTSGASCGADSDDRVLRTTNVVNFANLLAAAGCNSEIAIFGANNAMRFDTPVATWTDSRGDLHTSPMQPIIDMPVSIWIAESAAATQAANDVANANLLYTTNKIGVRFNPTYNNLLGNAGAIGTIGTVSCGAVGAVRGSAFYTANALNIYYVDGAFTGENCARTAPVGDGNISYMGTLANLASLAHEIGHAFGLRPANLGGHTNAVAGFANNNIMWGGGPPTRSAFTLGQAFRMNSHSDGWGGTMLIADGLIPGPGRACPPLTTNATCPDLARDWARP